MNNLKNEHDILKLFGVVSVKDILDFLEKPIAYNKIYSKPIPIEDYSKTNLSLSEFLISHAQFSIEPEDPFSLELRLFKGDQVILDNDKIFIKRSNACKQFIEKNISSINLNFFLYLKEDLEKNLFHKKEILILLKKYENKKFTVDNKKIIKIFNKKISFLPSKKDLSDIRSIQLFNPIENRTNFSIKFCKCLLMFLEQRRDPVFLPIYKSLFDNFNNLNIKYDILEKNNMYFNNNTIELLKHTASIFPINEFTKDTNNNYIPIRTYKTLDLISEICLKDITSFFLKYSVLDSSNLNSIQNIEKMIQSKDLINFLIIFLQK